MSDKIYDVIGCIIIIIFSPIIILGFIASVFFGKCIGRSLFILTFILIPFIKYKIISNNKEAWDKSVIDRIHAKKYYE
jgi:hypothetical protein